VAAVESLRITGRGIIEGVHRVVLVDTDTKQMTDLYGEPGRYVSAVALTRDGRHLYFTRALVQSDIWTMRLRKQRDH